jgi:outer membrane protein
VRVVAGFSCVLLAACATVRDPGTSKAPAVAWTAPASTVPAPLPKQQPADVGTLTLDRAIDLALTNNPATHTAWLEARAAQAALGSSRSTLYPELDLNAQFTRGRQATQGGATIFNTKTYGPSLVLSYLLFDFGGRAAQIEQARQTLIAANFTHNQTLQDVVLRTQQAFYGYLDAKALVDAQKATLRERQANLDAAEARHSAGVATIADVLQARTALSQAQLNYETFEGSLRNFGGALATIISVPVTTQFQVGELPANLPLQEITQGIDDLIARAEAQRSDYAAARAVAEQARARVSEVRSQGLPTFSLSGSTSRTYFSGAASTVATPYSIGINMRFPLFTGFRTAYDLREAKSLAEIAAENARSLQEQIALQVWTSYYDLSTAALRVRTSADLLATAQQAAEVAAGRYRNGVGNILDVLTAEAALESARAQEVQARTDWFLAVAQLAHDTGSLEQGESH